MADAQVKKALKDLSLPVKPSATKAAIVVADKVRKAGSATQAADVRKMLGTTYQEKQTVWEGGVVPLLVALLPLAKEKPMIEAVSLALSLALTESESNVALAAEKGVEKPLVELCKDKSMLVQQHAATAVAQVCIHGTQPSRAKILAAGGLKALTTIVKEVDTEEAIQKQGPPNKLIAYKPGQRQEEAIAAICAISCEAKTKKTAVQVGTLTQLITLAADEARSTRSKEETAGALLHLVSEPSNRRVCCDEGGLGPLVSLLGCGSLLAQTRAAGALRNMSGEEGLRDAVVRAGAVGPLLGLCQLPAGAAGAAHVEAAGALQQVANQPEGKEQLLLHRGPSVLGNLVNLETAAVEVVGSALAALAHMCTHHAVNEPSAILRQAATGFVPLQDQAGETGVVAKVVAVVEAGEPDMIAQALAALAALTLQHPGNARLAAMAGGAGAVVEAVKRQSEETVQANGLKALQAMARADDFNAREAMGLGVTARLIGMRRESGSEVVRGLAAALLEQLGVYTALDHAGNVLLGSRMLLAVPYHQQAQKIVPTVWLHLSQLRACRSMLRDALQAERRLLGAMAELALRDALAYNPARPRPFAAGATAAIWAAPERVGGEAQLLEAKGHLEQLHAGLGGILSRADVLYMAMAVAVEAAGGPSITMRYGRRDVIPDQVEDEADIGGPLADCNGPMYEEEEKKPKKAPGEEGEEEEEAAEEEEEGEEGEGEEEEEDGEKKKKEKEPLKPKYQVGVRLGRLGLTAREQAAVVTAYAALHGPEDGTRGPEGFTAWLAREVVGLDRTGGGAPVRDDHDTAGGAGAAGGKEGANETGGEGGGVPHGSGKGGSLEAMEEEAVGAEDSLGLTASLMSEGWRPAGGFEAGRGLLGSEEVVEWTQRLAEAEEEAALQEMGEALRRLTEAGADLDPPEGYII